MREDRRAELVTVNDRDEASCVCWLGSRKVRIPLSQNSEYRGFIHWMFMFLGTVLRVLMDNSGLQEIDSQF